MYRLNAASHKHIDIQSIIIILFWQVLAWLDSDAPSAAPVRDLRDEELAFIASAGAE